MSQCQVCRRPFQPSIPSRGRICCGPECARKRKRELARRREGVHYNAYDLMGLTAVEATQTLKPVSRREYQKIMESFFNMVLTPEEEVQLIFAEASRLGSGVRMKGGSLL